MSKNRLEAFSDGVMAIIVTIMVLEIKAPHGGAWNDLLALTPKFISYILSFAMVWIYWNNHHHLFQGIKKVTGKVLIANGNLLFWLSLLPFSTAWMGENNFAPDTVVLMGIVLLLCGMAYFILSNVLVKLEGPHSPLAIAVGKDYKGKISVLVYFIAIPLAFYYPLVSMAIYCLVALMWLIPDKRIEKVIEKD